MIRSSEDLFFVRATLLLLAVGGGEGFLANHDVFAAKPNILLIMADDLGYGDLSSYGAADLQSPNIDRLIQGGMRFINFYANCPVCSPRLTLTLGRLDNLNGATCVQTGMMPW